MNKNQAPKSTSHPRVCRNGDYGLPPASRSHSQPDFLPPREHRHSRGNSADLGHAAVRSYLGGDPRWGGAGHPSPQRAIHPGMPPQMGYGSPAQQHAPYPMGMYPYPMGMYPHGGVPQFSPGHGECRESAGLPSHCQELQ